VAKRRRPTPQRSRVYQAGVKPGFSRRSELQPAPRSIPWTWIAVGAVGVLAVLILLAFALGFLPGGSHPTPSPSPASTVDTSLVQPPDATPLASPPAQPAGDGTTATIDTDLGDIVIQLYNQSAPVAAQNFTNLANAGFYNGVVFHRIFPDFMIQGGDPLGTGTGGPGYTIPDEPVVGSFARGTVAMARTNAPNSEGSQFFILVADYPSLQGHGYTIFGTVTSGMNVVDQIVAGPRTGPQNDLAANPVVMRQVTIQPPT
jgi:peptidyl-prolyl cis-trans isomerase B (cyclophilin B)